MTPNYQIKYTKEFKKSIKKITKQGKKIDKLLNVIDKLSKRVPLEIKYHDHALYNDKKFNDCAVNIGKVQHLPGDEDSYLKVDMIRSVSIRRIRKRPGNSEFLFLSVLPYSSVS